MNTLQHSEILQIIDTWLEMVKTALSNLHILSTISIEIKVSVNFRRSSPGTDLSSANYIGNVRVCESLFLLK